MNEEQLLKLINDQKWNVEYYTQKIAESSALLELYTKTLNKLYSNE